MVARNGSCITSYKPLYGSVAFQFYSSSVIVLYFEYQKTSKSILRVEGHVVVDGICVCTPQGHFLSMPHSQRSMWGKDGWQRGRSVSHRTKNCGSSFGKDSEAQTQSAVASDLLGQSPCGHKGVCSQQVGDGV